ncbi:hypothetical protein EMIHUDRAFT_104883 [Emiliania huxleyi CCMP1516]|uniref:Ciliary BBSome complex subunit 2 N-terminal domain-containing protein n=2 Tax=Emiliania huxleyi TaxID=2903 RepID=A0A0D3IIN5_EMIH1|nr:hypothetical protein EMIHUDRAFT_104883 [Emiliania huxleyi CCMP1516]EOD11120.1 hypothetical protein EMIHUDRAFT_104883 [Emiliania huxleyi CCMP1516]|eukprot:XP_005763549.1 hypothetical protein EMIHUDRAFT_104883 [Emiliania huxleyi CCMP1516]
MLPAFRLELKTPILPGLVCVGKFDGQKTPSLVCATAAGKLFCHTPGEARPGEELRYLNINRKVSSLASGRLDPSLGRDILLVGTPTALLAYDIAENRDVFFRDAPDGANAIVVGQLAGTGAALALVGGNCSIQGLTDASRPRGARLRAWLDRGGDNWCRIELPPMHPQDFDVRWEPPVYGSPVRIYLSPSTNASSAGPQPPLASTAWPQLRVGGASPDQPLFVLNAPYGNLRNQIEKGHRVGRAKSGLGSGHKVANAYFHLRAIQYTPRHTRRCLAARCHPCLQRIGVHAAAVFEATPPTARDDVEYVQGSSPGEAATLPQLLHAAAAQTRARDGVTKLQLGVGNAGSGQEVNVASRKACAAPRCPRLTHTHPRGVGTDVYPVIAALQRAIFENAKNRSRMRARTLAGRRDSLTHMAAALLVQAGRDAAQGHTLGLEP